MHAQPSVRLASQLAAAYELSRQDVIDDAHTARTWIGPRDELIVRLSQRHCWQAEESVFYLSDLQRFGLVFRTG